METMSKKELDLVGVRLVPERKLYSEKVITCSEDAVALLSKELGEHDREVFCVLHLSAKGIPLSASIISVGELTSTLVHPRELFKSAVLSSAAGIVLLHNHPSGGLEPSNEDIKTTERLAICGQLMGIPIIDHIICAEHGYISMRASGHEHIFKDSDNLIKKFNEYCVPEMKLSEGKDEDYSQIKIVREIDGRRIEILLTKDELYKAFIEQQRIFEEDYVINYLEERRNDKKLRADFRAENGVDVNVFLKSDKLISKIATEMHRKADKYGMSEYEALEEAIKEEATELVQIRKEKALER